jgi:hypothetical protein
MADEIVVEQPVVEPAAEPAAEPVVEVVEEPLVEQRYTYQPKDETGRSIGGLQVIKYHTQEELVEKFQEQNTLLIRKLRKETRNNRLGILEDEPISDDAQRFTGAVEFKPRELSNEERYEIAHKLLDPTTAYEATETLIEAGVGAPLKVIGETLQGVQQDNIKLRARIEVDSFIAENHDYYKCSENQEAIIAWMLRYDLAPVKENFQKAYDTLRAQGVLIESGAVEEIPVAVEPVVVPVVEPVVEVVHELLPVAEIPIRVSSGLTRANSSDVGVVRAPGSGIAYEFIQDGQKKVFTGLAAVQAMPSDEYKRRLLTDKTFGVEVDKLEAAARKR